MQAPDTKRARFSKSPRLLSLITGAAVLAWGMLPASVSAQVACTAANTVTANVVVFDTLMIHNRLGAQNPNWFIYALRRDVVQGVGNQNPIGGALPPDPNDGLPEAAGGVLSPGNVSLRPDKRPRPLTLRVNVGQCLKINFENLLAPNANPFNAAQDALLINDQVATRFAGVHVAGMSLATSIADDSSNVGANANSCVAQGAGPTPFTFVAEHEGAFKLSNPCAAIGGEATGGNNALGMWGMVNVEPAGARQYRSQTYEEELRLAADADLDGMVDATTAQGQPIINYEAIYPNQQPWIDEGKAGLPILNMQCTADTLAAATAAGVTPAPCVVGEIVHSEVNAIIAGPNSDGTFPDHTYPLESVGLRNPALPNRTEAFREWSQMWHDEASAAQAFEGFFSHPVVSHTLHGVRDSFMINYASGGIGSEIIANRLGVGPMYDCLGCAYEEFFLASYTVGDPGMIVDVPANLGLEQVTPEQVAAQDPALVALIGPKATTAFYQDDPANIHNSYTGDFAKFRNVHMGPKEQHIFHLHNHQWLFNPNDDRANYLDAQGIGPGSSYTYEINYGGSGNRNKTAGDAIFHCHFYPHFAQGMWYHWRIHDVMETGTILAASLDGGANALYHDTPFALGTSQPALQVDVNASGLQNVDMTGLDPATTRNRAHPDGEILAGIPIPATVPMPGKAMAPMPGEVVLITKNVDKGKDNDPVTPGIQDLDDSSQAHVVNRAVNPGYPFWIAGVDCGNDPVNCESGIVGQRPLTPPMDMMSQAQAEAAFDAPGSPFPAMLDPNAGITAAEYRTAFVNAAGGFDGGLPRHAIDGCKAAGVATGGAVFSCTAAPALHDVGDLFVSAQTRLDFHKEVLTAKGILYPEDGTDLEKVAMKFHAQRNHSGTALNLDGAAPTPNVNFVLNGLPPVPGAPYSDPCVSDSGQALVGGGDFQFFAANGFFQGPIAPNRAWDSPFTYAAANIQIDAVFNKAGYHYPQQRIIALWGDVLPTINKEKAPEPFVMRLNSFNCAKYMHSNLVPKEFEVDDYQVRTPTDIIGQHIHLPKWDLTTTDGAANGWNYEDGTLATGMVRERIEAINHFNALAGNGAPELVAQAHPALGAGVGGEWVGSRVTLQRWFVDPLVDRDGIDRGLGIVFTHDHYGPSTFQQIGLYSTLLAEPAESTWVHNETGVELGTNVGRVGASGQAIIDGGPTSWQAAIVPGNLGENFTQINLGQKPYREFYFEFTDFQHAYEAGVYVGAGPDGRPFTGGAGKPSHNADGTNVAFPVTADTFRNAINVSFREQADPVFPDMLRYPPVCPGSEPGNVVLRPCPEAITADDSGMLVINYRQEPVGLRVFDPNKIGPDGRLGTQADGDPGDLALGLQSRQDRACEQMNRQPAAGEVAVPCLPVFPAGVMADTIYPPPINASSDVRGGDPFTPMIRAYDGDLVKVKFQAGGQEHAHSGTIHGVKWVQGNSGFGPDRPAAGWRNAQGIGISEQYNFSMPVLRDPQQAGNSADYAYASSASQDGWWSGTWGIMRSYRQNRNDLFVLPGSIQEAQGQPVIVNRGDFGQVCPNVALRRTYNLTAVLANDVLGNNAVLGGVTIQDNALRDTDGDGIGDNEGGPLNPAGGTLVYNPRPQVVVDPDTGLSAGAGPLHDPTGILYVRTEDMVDPLNPAAGLKAGTPIEPVVLRASAGECVIVNLRNRLPANVQATDNAGQPIFTTETLADGTVVQVPVMNSSMPDLAGYNQVMPMVIRDRNILMQGQPSVTTFNNNLVRPSSLVGLHPQLVEYDVTRADGTVVGRNNRGQNVAAPGEEVSYEWYMGDVRGDVNFVQQGNGGNRRAQITLVATPVEFGGANLSPADKIKQGQKGALGALVVEAAGATWDDSLAMLEQVPNRQDGGASMTGTRADMPISVGAGGYQDHVLMVQKGLNLRFADGVAVPNIPAEGPGVPEDSHDAGQKGANYGTEPGWFRLGISPNAGFAAVGDDPDVYQVFSNALVGGDPWTPVFTAPAGNESRVRVLFPHGVGRGSTFDLHGHVWARDPYLPRDPTCLLAASLAGCGLSSVSIGTNPLAMYLGGQESLMPYQHFEVRLPKAGGVNAITGDYLWRDHGSFGVSDGIWGILRVQ